MVPVCTQPLYGKTEQVFTLIIWKQLLNVLFLPVTPLVYSSLWQRLQVMILLNVWLTV